MQGSVQSIRLFNEVEGAKYDGTASRAWRGFAVADPIELLGARLRGRRVSVRSG